MHNKLKNIQAIFIATPDGLTPSYGYIYVYAVWVYIATGDNEWMQAKEPQSEPKEPNKTNNATANRGYNNNKFNTLTRREVRIHIISLNRIILFYKWNNSKNLVRREW